MISTTHPAIWRETRRPLRRRPVRSPASPIAGDLPGDCHLVDGCGTPLGVITAPRPGALFGANGPTVYLRRSPEVAGAYPDHAA